MESHDGSNDSRDVKSEIDNKHQDRHAPATDDNHGTPKKRRKVNHACVYCRRSHMTCDLAKSVLGTSVADESEAPSDVRRSSREQQAGSMGPPSSFDSSGLDAAAGSGQAPKTSFDASALGSGNPLQLVQPTPVSGIQANANTMTSNLNQLAGFSDTWMTTQNHFHDMHNFNPNYMVVPEVSNEFNLLDDFLHSSMVDDGALLPDTIGNQPDTVPGFLSNFSTNTGTISAGSDHLLPSSAMHSGSMLPPPLATGAANSNADKARAITRPSSVVPIDKARDYWLQAADPAGNDTPAERMNKLLRAKYEAGLLKPFNYVKGYMVLSKYLESHVAPASRQKISRQLDRFRPKFREKMQALTDMDLILVEMWFEETLMSYDRVFASMAVPGCCWRRTGEIFRGNKEMAELINVPVECLRDGKIALHEILTEESVVRYWEEFGTIAFDSAHETLLTACTLKSPDDKSNRPTVNCCFSFKILRDDHKMYAPRGMKSWLTPKSRKEQVGRTFQTRRFAWPIRTSVQDSSRGTYFTSYVCRVPDFATSLEKRLTTISPASPVDDQLLAALQTHVRTLHGYCQKPSHPSSSNEELEKLGTSIWNLSTRLMRDTDGGPAWPDRRRLVVYARVFAFHILDAAQHSGKVDLGNKVRLMRLALKAGKSSIEASELEMAGFALEKGADYIRYFGEQRGRLVGDDAKNIRGLEAEYYILRTALSWKEDRLDVAEHMYSKSHLSNQSLDPHYAEKLADVLYEIGKDMTAKKDFQMAEKWLGRAKDLVNSHDLEQLSHEALDLRAAIMQAYVTALINLETTEGFAQADNLVQFLQSEMGNTMIVLVLKLELLIKAPAEVFDSDAYATILGQMITCFKTQKEPRTLYLMYKIAVRSDDREAATKCIEGISKAPEPLEHLYACCLDAQAARHKEYAIEALSKLLEKNAHSPSSPIHLPALLRCTVRLMAKDLEGQEDETGRHEAVQKLCEVFNEVVLNIERDPKDAKGNKLFDINELDWFARNTYNLGLKNLEAWDVSHTIQILTACTKIMSHFPADISSEIAADIALKTLFNDFIVASALLARARGRDNVEDQLQDYLLMRKHIADFDANLPAQLPALVEQARADMLSKLAALLTFDFEGAVVLKSWDELGPIVLKTGDCNSVVALQAMADCLLRSPDTPTQTVYATLRAIINALSILDVLDVVKLARYMRCLFQVTLPFDGTLALGLADEYVRILTETAESRVPLPREETEWLATAAFNHAVDCYFAKQDGLCKEWAAKAFALAHLVADGGGLERVLHERFMRLRFDVK
ncbi:SPO22-domain-containing protein [Coniochaeta ligniaria NRRL 30616]|uniref:SPO22-domain-containing protein n=1 Tax=Coniochaeta ligniaria NRRL 30616 TaxID=1408157 RepID=A0A1J7IIM1_9PEZI|nr:SPO22-domain-containing protein [Coniochaeta ligniaria NRRL 30616]